MSTITLIDGRTLPLFPKPEQPKEVVPDTLKLDTTGEYLVLGKIKPQEAKDLYWTAKRQYNHHILFENAWFLLEHAEEIFSDSRMFLAPVKVVNGLAYTGTSGLNSPTLGVYLEWWLNYKAAIDANGNLVWYISGSPLSGRNCCKAVDPEGKSIDMDQHTRFIEVWSSFMEVNRRYTEAKQTAMAYTLEEVLVKLRGEGFRYRILELKHEMIEQEILREKNVIARSLEYVTHRFEKHLSDNQKLQLELSRERIIDFALRYFNKEQELKPVHEKYLKEYKRLKQQQKDGTLNGDFRVLRREISKEYLAWKHELSNLANAFMHDLLGKNINQLTLEKILKFARKELKRH